MESIGPNNLATVSYSYIHRALYWTEPRPLCDFVGSLLNSGLSPKCGRSWWLTGCALKSLSM